MCLLVLSFPKLNVREVDSFTPKSLHPRIRDQVLVEMEVQYAHA
jgi:hypothetical protein